MARSSFGLRQSSRHFWLAAARAGCPWWRCSAFRSCRSSCLRCLVPRSFCLSTSSAMSTASSPIESRFRRGISQFSFPRPPSGSWPAILWPTRSMTNAVRILIGGVGLSFLAMRLRSRLAGRPEPRSADVPRGVFWGSISGFTSFVSHAGGPAFQVYALPQQMPKLMFAGTSTILFASINLMKVPPYVALGLMDRGDAGVVAVLAPVAVFRCLARIQDHPDHSRTRVLSPRGDCALRDLGEPDPGRTDWGIGREDHRTRKAAWFGWTPEKDPRTT